MKSDTISKGNLKTLAIIFGVFVLLYFIYKIQALLLFIFISTVLTLIGRPIVLFLNRYLKFNNTLAAASTLAIFIAILVITLWIFVPIILYNSKSISEIDFNSVKTDLNELNVQASEYLGLDRINIIEAFKRTKFIKNFDSDFILSFFQMLVNNLASFLAGIIAVIFISFFLLRD